MAASFLKRFARGGAEPAPAMRPDHEPERVTLADPELQAQLEAHGFAVVPLLDADGIAEVRAAYARLGPAPDDPQIAINWSFHSESAAYKAAVKEEMLELVGSRLSEALVDHETYLTTFITKWPGPNGTFAPHQDPSLVDERVHRGVTVWMPLADTGPSDDEADNGMLHVVPGSHRFSRSLRVSDVDQNLFADHEEAIVTRHGVGVPTRAGEALVFDNRLIHYSLPNQTDAERVVLSFGVRPVEGECILLRRREPDLLDVYRVHDDFYIDVLPAAQHLWQPSGAPMATLRIVPEHWSAAEFDELCAAAGPAPRTTAPVVPREVAATDPGVFCALCGSSEGLTAEDRRGRNNAQLVCPSCRARVQGAVLGEAHG